MRQSKERPKTDTDDFVEYYKDKMPPKACNIYKQEKHILVSEEFPIL